MSMVLVPVLLAACNPAMNWRETRFKDTALVAMLPCKPDQGARVVPLGGRNVSLHMTGCDAGGATFAVAYANLDGPGTAPAVLAQWRTATLANMGAVSSREVPLGGTPNATSGGTPNATSGGTPSATSGGTGSAASTGLLLVTAQGQRKDGSAVAMQGAWFAKDAQVFHAVVYAERISPEVTEAFFSGLRFQ